MSKHHHRREKREQNKVQRLIEQGSDSVALAPFELCPPRAVRREGVEAYDKADDRELWKLNRRLVRVPKVRS